MAIVLKPIGVRTMVGSTQTTVASTVRTEPSVKELTYADVIQEHQELDIDFNQTLGVIRTLFPDCIEAAIELWNTFEAQKLVLVELVVQLPNDVVRRCQERLDRCPTESLDSLVVEAIVRYLDQESTVQDSFCIDDQ
jgi:hypothetical protein